MEHIELATCDSVGRIMRGTYNDRAIWEYGTVLAILRKDHESDWGDQVVIRHVPMPHATRGWEEE